MFGYRWVLAKADAPAQFDQVLFLPGWSQGSHLVQYDTEGPYIGLLVVWLDVEDLRRQVKGRPHN